MASTTSKNVYQFKIILKNSKPQIWRRIQVPETFNFWDFHVAIQDAMGWKDSHLHQFDMINPKTGKKVLIGMPDPDGYEYFANTIPEKTVKIADFFFSSNPKATYEYDFGDGWVHRIVFEIVKPEIAGMQYPQCIEGKQACPPEDCGGNFGYKELREIIANPQHKEYKERMEWLEHMKRSGFLDQATFDPEFFDPKLVVFMNPEERWKMAFETPIIF